MLSTRNRQPIGKKVSSSRIWIMFWKFVTFYRHYVAFLRVMCVCVAVNGSFGSGITFGWFDVHFNNNVDAIQDKYARFHSFRSSKWNDFIMKQVTAATTTVCRLNHILLWCNKPLYNSFFSSSIQFNIILLNESRSMAHFNHNVCCSTRCLCQQTIVAKMLAFVLLQPHFSISWFDFSCLASIFTTNCVKKRFTWMCAISFRIAYFYVAKLIEKFHAKRRSRLHEAQFFPFIQFKYGTWRQ